MSTPCVITFYKDNNPSCNITTGDLSTTEILDVLKTLMVGFSRSLIKECIEECGTDNPQVLNQYLQDKLNLDRQSIDEILGNTL